MLGAIRKFAFSTRKDYYKILSIQRDASIEDIKAAYIQQAKIFHPDVRTDNVDFTNVEKFKDIAEAYAVLSVQESKTSYDLLNTGQPDMLNLSKREQYYRKMQERGQNGQRPKESKYTSQETIKRQLMQEERDKFNVDLFGRYKGGLPQKGLGYFRNSSMGLPGSIHDPLHHNFAINPIPDNEHVTKQDALYFKHYVKEDQDAISKKKFWFPAKVDYEFTQFNPWKRWTRNILLFLFGFGSAIEIYHRRFNRSIVRQLRLLAKNNEKVDKIKGLKIRRSEDGCYSLV